MHDLPLLTTLAGGLSVALVLGYITQRIGLSSIVGYLIAGTLVGPHTPGFIADAELAEQLAEVGVILLMFGVGLQFHVEELLAVRRVAVPGAVVQSAAATVLGAAIARAFGWDWPGAIVFGVALSVASTVVLIRVLADNNDLHTPAGHIAVGWLVVEDLFTVIALVLLPALFGGGGAGSAWGLAGVLGLTLLKVSGLVGFTVVVGNRVIPWLLDRVAASRSRELFTLTVLVLALGIAVGAAAIFGVSMALGAFMAGMVVGRSDYSHRAASEALPMRDAFAVLFFVSVGMLLDPLYVFEAPVLILATLTVVLVAKPLVALLLVRILRYPFRTALAVAVALAQIGEFSFILSSVGRELGILTVAATNTLVAVAILSIVVNPLLYRAVEPVERMVARRPWLSRLLNPAPGADATLPSPAPAAAARERAVVLGYGPTGRAVTRLLHENGVEPVVVELNMDTVRRLRLAGTMALYGDASQSPPLEAAGIRHAAHLVLTSAGMKTSEEAIRLARELNPSIHVIARATYLRDVAALRKAGAGDVFSGEGEVALALTVAVLHRLGATPEQIERERRRVYEELLNDAAGVA
jgi:CPA2 family monovalent cation:H+ antiporter-2